MFAGKKSAQIREILISESAWEEMTCLFAPSLADYGAQLYNSSNEESTISLVMPDAIEWNGKNTPRRQYMIKYIAVFKY